MTEATSAPRLVRERWRPRTPATRVGFGCLAATSWFIAPFAEGVSSYLFLLSPHNAIADASPVALLAWIDMVLVSVVAAPFVVVVVAPVLYRYPGSVPVLWFRRERPVLSAALWLVFGALTSRALWVVAATRHVWEVPWALASLVDAYFLLTCNAAIGQASWLKPDPDEPTSGDLGGSVRNLDDAASGADRDLGTM